MWVWTIFDLPVVTKTERKRASRFRHDLLELGFEMVQFSVYLKHAGSRELAEALARQVGDCVPRVGKVQVLFFTDKQYGMSHVYHGGGGRIKPQKKPRQLRLF